MRSILLKSGLTLLASQNQNLNSLINITGFSLGAGAVSQTNMETWDEAEPANSLTMTGPVVLNSDASYMYYTPSSGDNVKLTCLVPDSIAEIPVANVTLYATYGGVTVPFSFHAADTSFIKLQTQNASPGISYWFDLMLNIPNLSERFSFANLPLRLPTFQPVLTDQNMPPAHNDGPDNWLIEAHILDGKPVLAFNAEGVHYGFNPTMQPLTLGDPLIITGGISGDGYLTGVDTIVSQEQIVVFRSLGLKFSLVNGAYSEDYTQFDYYFTLKTGSVILFQGSTITGDLYRTDDILVCDVDPLRFPLTLDSYDFTLERSGPTPARTTVLAGVVIVEVANNLGS